MRYALTIAAAAVALAATASPALAKPAGTIVFEQRGKTTNLYIARADGSTGAIPLTSKASAPDPDACFDVCLAEGADWLSDGSRIFFDSSWDKPIHLWSMKPDGTDIQQLSSGDTYDGYPGVSDDGALIAYDYSPPDDGNPHDQGIFIRELGSSAPPRRLTRQPRHGLDGSPDLSPDGTRVAFTRLRKHRGGPRVSVMVVNTDGTGLRHVTDGRLVWGDPHWSPDGSKLLIQSGDEPSKRFVPVDEWTIRPDGTHLKRLTRSGRHAGMFSGSWSPDGTQIAYVSYTEQRRYGEIRIMSASGQDQSLVAKCDRKRFCDVPMWSPYTGPLPAR